MIKGFMLIGEYTINCFGIEFNELGAFTPFKILILFGVVYTVNYVIYLLADLFWD